MEHSRQPEIQQPRLAARWMSPTGVGLAALEGRRDATQLQRLLVMAELGTLTDSVAQEDVTVEQLKVLLRIRGLPANGSKRVLLERLRSPAGAQRIQPLFLNGSGSDLGSPPPSQPHMWSPTATTFAAAASLNGSLSPRYHPYNNAGPELDRPPSASAASHPPAPLMDPPFLPTHSLPPEAFSAGLTSPRATEIWSPVPPMTIDPDGLAFALPQGPRDRIATPDSPLEFHLRHSAGDRDGGGAIATNSHNSSIRIRPPALYHNGGVSSVNGPYATAPSNHRLSGSFNYEFVSSPSPTSQFISHPASGQAATFLPSMGMPPDAARPPAPTGAAGKARRRRAMSVDPGAGRAWSLSQAILPPPPSMRSINSFDDELPINRQPSAWYRPESMIDDPTAAALNDIGIIGISRLDELRLGDADPDLLALDHSAGLKLPTDPGSGSGGGLAALGTNAATYPHHHGAVPPAGSELGRGAGESSYPTLNGIGNGIGALGATFADGGIEPVPHAATQFAAHSADPLVGSSDDTFDDLGATTSDFSQQTSPFNTLEPSGELRIIETGEIDPSLHLQSSMFTNGWDGTDPTLESAGWAYSSPFSGAQ